MNDEQKDNLGWGILFLIAAFYLLAFGNGYAGAKIWNKTMWGGFTEGKLDEPLMDDFWSGHNERTVPAFSIAATGSGATGS